MEQREIELDLEIREESESTVVGVAVPYDETIDLGGVRERFQRGAIDPADTQDAILLYGHKDPIGKITRGEETESGYLIEARISDTERGREVRTLLKDGVLKRFSVGFEPIEDTRDGDVIVRSKVRLREASIVPFAAYDKAKVLAVREEPEPEQGEEEVTEETTTEVAELRQIVDDIERRMAVAPEPTEPSNRSLADKFESRGHWLHAIVSGDDDAHALYKALSTRAFPNAVDGATIASDAIDKNAWVDESIRLLDFGRPTMLAFRNEPLPSSGMNVEWPKVTSDSMQVAPQANEADELVFGKISMGSETAPVQTVGGWTTLSRQAIERSSYGFLDASLRALSIAHSKYLNARAITELKNLSGTHTADVTAGTAKAWLDAIAQASVDIYTNTGYRLDRFICAPDVWVKLVTLMDGFDRPLLSVYNGSPVNTIGATNLVGIQATLGGLPVIVDPALDAGTCYLASHMAYTSWTSGGPFRLQDEDVVTLVKEYSLYSYVASACQYPLGIVKVTTTTP